MIFNTQISNSFIILFYQIIYLLFFRNFKKYDIISPLFIINLFIILVMCTSCSDNYTKGEIIIALIMKIILLFVIILVIDIDFSFKNYLIGSIIILIYYEISDINKIYKCNVDNLELLYCFIISSIIYYLFSMISKHHRRLLQ